MNGGLLKSASAVAIFAAAGLFASANAADLGGDCCADLEERVAELEATTVRKGNRKVRLTVSGFVGHQVMFWDDGVRSDSYIGDGGNIFSRFRFTGTAKISPQVSAGFTYEFGIHNNAIGSMTQDHRTAACSAPGSNTVNPFPVNCARTSADNGDDLGGAVSLRDSTVYLEHRQMGRVKIGHGSTATDNLILIDLGGKGAGSTPDNPLYVGAMRLAFSGATNYSRFNQAQIQTGGIGFDTARRNHVMYQTPTLAGFTLQAAVAEDNYWDVALRYAGEFGGFRLAGGIGYQEDTEFNTRNFSNSFDAALGSTVICDSNCAGKATELKGSASVLHVPTGLFVTGAAGRREWENLQRVNANAGTGAITSINGIPNGDAMFWYLSGGISQNFFGIGRTVLYGEYGENSDFLTQLRETVSDSDSTMWGIGITQHVDAAAMEVFATYKNFSGEYTENNAKVNVQDLGMVLVGTRINF